MELKDYIVETACSVLEGIRLTDATLREQRLGKVWMEDIVTHGADLVSVGLLKRQASDGGNKNKSVPLLVLQYDVNVTLEDRKKTTGGAELEAGAKALHIFSFKAKVNTDSKAALIEKSVQNVKFSVPIDFADN